MRLVFFGTPAFAVPSLKALLAAGHEIRAVVTQPDRPVGRSRALTPPPVKVAALEAGLPVLQPEKPAGPEFEAALRACEAEFGIVVAYGHLIRPAVLAIPAHGMLNVHGSLLPRWRGAAPIEWAILAGDAETGVGIMQMEAGLDTGPVYAEARTPIGDEETAGELRERLSKLGARTLAEALPGIADGSRTPRAQAADGVTYAKKLDRALARLDLTESAVRVSARMRAFDPAPGAWALLHDQPIKLFRPQVVSEAIPAALGREPGSMLAQPDAMLLRTGHGTALRVRRVQPAGKPALPAGDWLRGLRGLEGVVLA
jgi:methionyl-tRNA formyltransferase